LALGYGQRVQESAGIWQEELIIYFNCDVENQILRYCTCIGGFALHVDNLEVQDVVEILGLSGGCLAEY
jgi:hypothetical protein